MKKITNIKLNVLRNDEHAQFHTEVKNLIAAETSKKLGIEQQYIDYDNWLNIQKKTMLVDKGSVYTAKVRDTDNFRNQLDKCFTYLVDSRLEDFENDLLEAARRVDRILKQYGNIRILPLNEKSQAIENRNLELHTKYAADLATIGAMRIVKKLDNVNTAFMKLFNDRSEEKSATMSANVTNTRIDVDKAYETIVERVNALALINGEEAYSAFIDKVNYYIDYYKKAHTPRRTRKDTEKESEQEK